MREQLASMSGKEASSPFNPRVEGPSTCAISQYEMPHESRWQTSRKLGRCCFHLYYPDRHIARREYYENQIDSHEWALTRRAKGQTYMFCIYDGWLLRSGACGPYRKLEKRLSVRKLDIVNEHCALTSVAAHYD
jgi:hypothetical protein